MFMNLAFKILESCFLFCHPGGCDTKMQNDNPRNWEHTKNRKFTEAIFQLQIRSGYKILTFKAVPCSY